MSRLSVHSILLLACSLAWGDTVYNDPVTEISSGGTLNYYEISWGTNAAWSPTDLGDDLTVWFDGSDWTTMWVDTGSLTNSTPGDGVIVWDNKATTNNHAGHGSKYPSLSTNSFSAGAVYFASSKVLAFAIDVTQAVTNDVFIVADTTSTPTGWVYPIARDGTGCLPFFGTSGNPQKPLVYGANTDAIWTTSVTRKAIFLWRVDGTDTAVNVDNGTEVTDATGTATRTVWTHICTNVAAHSPLVHIAEILIINNLSTADRAKVWTYLENKWGL